MKRGLAAAMVVSAGVLLTACKGTGRAPAPEAKVVPPTTVEMQQEVVAKVNGHPITMAQLREPLMESYGLNVLLQFVQLEMARQEAAREGVTVSAQDIQAERELTINRLAEKANEKLADQLEEAESKGQAEEAQRLRAEMRQNAEQLLEQFLANRRIARPEFDLLLETNAYLRAIAKPLIANRITDDNLQEAFGILYGENVKVRHIQVSNLQEIAEAQRRLKAGEPFPKVARELSRNRETGALGGEMPQFSRNTPNMPEVFKETAFALEVGEVSEPVQAGGAYHLIKLEEKIAPKAVKFQDVKESVREQLHDRLLQATINELRQGLAQKAMQNLQILEPVLAGQFQQRLAERQGAIREQEEIKRQMERDRSAVTTQEPATAPATRPAAPFLAPGTTFPVPVPGTQPITPERPPATGSGPTPDQPVAPATQSANR